MSREGADARLVRLLAIVPWIAAHDGPSVAEVCRRFGVAEKDLVADLNLLFMCGVHPFTPDVLIDVHFADGRVWISMADYFRRPLRLSPQEGLALVSAGRTLMEFPGAERDGPLASALAKLDRVLGLDGDDVLEVDLGRVDPATLVGLRSAAEIREKVRIRYYSFGRDARSERVVRPWRVFNSAGEWYLQAFCEAAGAERHFRIDRIEALEPTGEHFDPPEPEVAGATAAFRPQAGDPRWVLDLRPGAHWIAEQYPHEHVEARQGNVLRVTLRASPNAWMERLLLRGGADVTVVEGVAGFGRAAAARVLARYRG